MTKDYNWKTDYDWTNPDDHPVETKEEIQKTLDDPMCQGIMHRIPWGMLTAKDNEGVSNLLCSTDYSKKAEPHLKIQKILKQYPKSEREVN